MILKHLELSLANSEGIFPTTTTLTLSKSPSTMGLKFPTGKMLGWVN